MANSNISDNMLHEHHSPFRPAHVGGLWPSWEDWNFSFPILPAGRVWMVAVLHVPLHPAKVDCTYEPILNPIHFTRPEKPRWKTLSNQSKLSQQQLRNCSYMNFAFGKLSN
jgi:hypothetical protein